MDHHYGFFSDCVHQTIDEVVSRVKPRYYNDRVMSDKTKEFYQQRICDYNSGSKITKSDRAAWAKVLRQTGLEDYKDWVVRWVTHIESADESGDAKTIHQGVKALFGKTYNVNSTQPSKEKMER